MPAGAKSPPRQRCYSDMTGHVACCGGTAFTTFDVDVR